jgi:hypothetical protein
MAMDINGIITLLLVLLVWILVAWCFVEIAFAIIGWLLRTLKKFDWYNKSVDCIQKRTAKLGDWLLPYIHKSWDIYTEYLADLLFFGLAIGFLVEKLAPMSDITWELLADKMTEQMGFYIAFAIVAMLWVYAKMTLRDRAANDKKELEQKLYRGFTDINNNLKLLIKVLKEKNMGK